MIPGGPSPINRGQHKITQPRCQTSRDSGDAQRLVLRGEDRGFGMPVRQSQINRSPPLCSSWAGIWKGCTESSGELCTIRLSVLVVLCWLLVCKLAMIRGVWEWYYSDSTGVFTYGGRLHRLTIGVQYGVRPKRERGPICL